MGDAGTPVLEDPREKPQVISQGIVLVLVMIAMPTIGASSATRRWCDEVRFGREPDCD